MDTFSIHDDDDDGRKTDDEVMMMMIRHHGETETADIASGQTTTTTTTTSGKEKKVEEDKKFTGLETFLVGISPMYWANVPMSILDIHNLQLVNGIHCMNIKNNNNNDSIDASSSSCLVAVSKCSLMGMVVLVEQRSGSSILFVLDDGTALIDCLLWMDKDIFELPSLTGQDTIDKCYPHVGQMIRVLGRIECVAVILQQQQEQHCIREIHVTLWETIPVSSQAQPHSFNAESLHWLEYSRRFETTTTTSDNTNCNNNNDNNSGAMMQMPMQKMNANYILHHYLGPDITQQVLRRESLPSLHDKMASWKLFGVKCQCTRLKYIDELLYCHCQATTLVNNNNNNNSNNNTNLFDHDTGFIYRDALLNRLLEMQTQQQQQQDQQSEKDDNNNNDKHKTQQQQQQPLQFQYKTLAMDSQLLAVLDNNMENRIQTSTTTTSSLTLQQQQHQQNHYHHRRNRVIQKTFAALRKDGILALLSVETDVYLLISRSLVLEPFIRKQIINSTSTNSNTMTAVNNSCPDYLSNVPKARLEFVRRTMSSYD